MMWQSIGVRYTGGGGGQGGLIDRPNAGRYTTFIRAKDNTFV